MKTILATCLLIFLTLCLFSQKTEVIRFDLSQNTSSYSISDDISVHINVQSPSYPNLLKHYDANPFEKPVISTEKQTKLEIAGALEQYLESMGIKSVAESNNLLNLRVELCALNFLSGKGWTATVKLNLQVLNRNIELLYQDLSGYREEGGKEKNFKYAQTAICNAFFDAFDGLNWEQLAASLSKDSNTKASDVLNDDRASVNDGSGGISQSGYGSNEESIRTGNYHALIIAIEDYHYLNTLDQPVDDANKLIEILNSSYAFEKENIIFLRNPTREEIIDKLDFLVKIVKKEDNLLIFYAGHGYWDAKRETGYWLPIDAKQSSTANWLRNSTIQEYIGDIHSKHTLLIADACFGGGIFKTRKAFDDAPSSIKQIHELSSRKAMTSGYLNEVPDKSVFFEYLSKRLVDNKRKYISSLQLFSSFMDAVSNNSDNVPRYGTIQKAGDEGGDFVFINTNN